MNTCPIKLGIIGCGGIARAHLAAARKNAFSITCVSDISSQAVEAFLANIPDARGFTSFTEMLDNGDMDAVIICTPPHSHAEVAITALERGIHVLCEKPLAATREEATAIETAADASKAILMTAFRHRFIPAHRAIKALLEGGELGRIILFQNVFGGPARQMKDLWFSKFAISGGGTLMDTSIHGIDLFRHYCGEVATFGGELDRAFEGTDVEDSAVLSLRAENGALGIIASSWNYGAGVADMRIITENGSVFFNYAEPTLVRITRLGRPEPEIMTVERTDGNAEQLAHFVDAILTATTPMTNARDGRRAVEIVEGVYQQRSPRAAVAH